MSYKTTLHYSNKSRSGITLGGIGTGGIELRQDGIFYNWHIFNNLPLGNGPKMPYPEEAMLFFKIRYQEPGKRPRIKLLQIDSGMLVAGIELYRYTFPWLSGVEQIDYEARFPFTTLTFRDPEMPFIVELEAFSPFIPHDVKNSALPGVIFNFKLSSLVQYPVDVTVLASLRNAVGYDVPKRRAVSTHGAAGNAYIAEMSVEGIPTNHVSFGSLALASLHPDSGYYLGWCTRHRYYEDILRQGTLPNIDNTAEALSHPDPQTGERHIYPTVFNTLGLHQPLAADSTLEHTFVLGWHFPNLYTEDKDEDKGQWEGNYYAHFFDNASQVVVYIKDNLITLTTRTREFLDNFYESSINPLILDQINSQLNTLVTSTWLTRDGKFALQEGLTADQSWGPMSTIDVGTYGSITALALFPSLDQAMWRTHRYIQAETGEISHGVDRNFAHFEAERPGVPTRVDLSAQYAINVLRNYFWTGDRTYLQEMWSSVKRALDYMIQERDANQDKLPDMNGPNSSYDNIAMYGASSFVSLLWLSGLVHTIEAACALDDKEAVQRYQSILEEAKTQVEQKLWTGEYYRLYNDLDGPTKKVNDGCLTDQLLGVWANHLVGLPPIIDQKRVSTILPKIMQMSYDTNLGLRNCSWPNTLYWGEVPPDCWWDQSNTTWTGSALAFAALLLYEGYTEDAQKTILTLDHYYRIAGLYFDHQEWGGHYYRPMSAWSIVNAYLGLTINQGCYRFAPKVESFSDEVIKLFFAFAFGTAHYIQHRANQTIILAVLSGVLTCQTLIFDGCSSISSITIGGKMLTDIKLSETDRTVTITFAAPLTISAGNSLHINLLREAVTK